jgi:hypothetical protein
MCQCQSELRVSYSFNQNIQWFTSTIAFFGTFDQFGDSTPAAVTCIPGSSPHSASSTPPAAKRSAHNLPTSRGNQSQLDARKTAKPALLSPFPVPGPSNWRWHRRQPTQTWVGKAGGKSAGRRRRHAIPVNRWLYGLDFPVRLRRLPLESSGQLFSTYLKSVLTQRSQILREIGRQMSPACWACLFISWFSHSIALVFFFAQIPGHFDSLISSHSLLIRPSAPPPPARANSTQCSARCWSSLFPFPSPIFYLHFRCHFLSHCKSCPLQKAIYIQ